MKHRTSLEQQPEIVVVDDQPGILDFFGTVLEHAGYRVEVAGDGLTALGLLSRGRVPLLITDLKMPGMDGLQLTKKTRERHPGTKIIAVSGEVGTLTGSLLDMAIGMGAERALVKPVTAEQLIQAVRAVIYPEAGEKAPAA